MPLRRRGIEATNWGMPAVNLDFPAFMANYVWDRSRDSASEGFTTSDSAVDVRVRHVS